MATTHLVSLGYHVCTDLGASAYPEDFTLDLKVSGCSITLLWCLPGSWGDGRLFHAV